MSIVTASGWQEPEPEKVKRPSVNDYPLPWHLSWTHEWACEIRDATGKIVCVVDTLHGVGGKVGAGTWLASDIAEFIVKSVNKEK